MKNINPLLRLLFAAAPSITLAILIISHAQAVETNCYTRDPSTIVKSQGVYWLYGTGTGVQEFSSPDRLNWTYQGKVFPSAPAWVASTVPANKNNTAWAPDVSFFGGTWHLYYCYSTFGSNVSGIGVATNATLDPRGWVDQGRVVQTGSNTSYNALDPGIFLDAAGNPWLSFGSYFSGIKLIQIDPATGKQATGNPTVYTLANHPQSSSNSIEASEVYYHAGFYYLFVNWDGCCNGNKSTYNIRIGRSPNVTGPYLDKAGNDMNTGGGTLFLGSVENTGTGATYDDEVGPGHAGILSDTDGDYFSCHYEWARDRQGKTTVNLLKLTWDSSGWPRVPLYNGPFGAISGMNYTLTCQHSGLNLDDPNSSTAAGTVLQQASSDGSSAQQFKIDDLGDGDYKLTNAASGLCLDDPNVSAGGPVDLAPDNGLDGQKWLVEPTGEGYYKLTCRQNSLCLDDTNGSTTAGTNIGLWHDNGLDTQRWRMAVQPDFNGIVSGATYKLTNVQSQLCLDDTGGSLNPGTLMQQYTDNGLEPQHWKIENVGGYCYTLTCQQNGLCLDDPNRSHIPGTTLRLWNPLGIPSQQWHIFRQADGTYILMCRQNKLLLDNSGSSSAGTLLVQGTANGSPSQRWILTKQ